MKLIAACLSIIIFVTSQATFADDSTQKNLSISVKNLNGLYIRKSLSEFTMLYAGIGISKGQQSASNDSGFGASNSTNNYTTYTGAVGARKYLNNDKVSKFINLELGRSFAKVDNSFSSSTAGSDSSDVQSQSTSANITYGIEYFISSNISVEGAAGIGMYWTDDTSSYGTNSTTKGVSFPSANIALTYYW